MKTYKKKGERLQWKKNKQTVIKKNNNKISSYPTFVFPELQQSTFSKKKKKIATGNTHMYIALYFLLFRYFNLQPVNKMISKHNSF